MRAFLLLPLLALAACDGGAQPAPQTKVPPPPAEVCSQVKAALEQIAEKGGFLFDSNGGATVPEAAWMMMGERRSQFAQTLAYHAACVSPDGAAERRVIVRNENGRVLMEAMVPTGILANLLPEASSEGVQP